eukprot:5984096-Prymnesium_polylepis.1
MSHGGDAADSGGDRPVHMQGQVSGREAKQIPPPRTGYLQAKRHGERWNFGGNLLILPDTHEGAVPHRDRPARIPWSV